MKALFEEIVTTRRFSFGGHANLGGSTHPFLMKARGAPSEFETVQFSFRKRNVAEPIGPAVGQVRLPTALVTGLTLMAVIDLGGCRTQLGTGGAATASAEEKTQVDARILALKAHLTEEESVEAKRPERIAVPQVPMPAGLDGPQGPVARPAGVAAYRQHIALLGEKQLLADMQIAMSNVKNDPDATRSKSRLAEFGAQLDAIEEAQRQRDRALGIERSSDHP
jgi:hypothetical protein